MDFNLDTNKVGLENASGPNFFAIQLRCDFAVMTSPHNSHRANSFSSVVDTIDALSKPARSNLVVCFIPGGLSSLVVQSALHCPQ